MDTEDVISRYRISPDALLDQHFMTDEKMISRIILAAGLKRKDVVMEIGAGVGTLTPHIAEKCSKVIAVEIDKRLMPALRKSVEGRSNVDIIADNALSILEKRNVKFSKIVSNTPYSICESLLNLLAGMDFELAVLSVPVGFWKIISGQEDSLLSFKTSVFFSSQLKFNIPKKSFVPVPGTESVLVTLRPLSGAEYRKDKIKYLFREMFLQKQKKIRNSLMEAIINFSKKIEGKHCTKNIARGEMAKIKLDEKTLQRRIGELRLDELYGLERKLSALQ